MTLDHYKPVDAALPGSRIDTAAHDRFDVNSLPISGTNSCKLIPVRGKICDIENNHQFARTDTLAPTTNRMSNASAARSAQLLPIALTRS